MNGDQCEPSWETFDWVSDWVFSIIIIITITLGSQSFPLYITLLLCEKNKLWIFSSSYCQTWAQLQLKPQVWTYAVGPLFTFNRNLFFLFSPLLPQLRQLGDAEDVDMEAGPGQGEDDAQARHHHRVQLEHPLDRGDSRHWNGQTRGLKLLWWSDSKVVQAVKVCQSRIVEDHKTRSYTVRTDFIQPFCLLLFTTWCMLGIWLWVTFSWHFDFVSCTILGQNRREFLQAELTF